MRERIDARAARCRCALDEDAVVRAAAELAAEGVEAIAVSFLFSFLNPAHERRAREIIREHHPI